MINYIIQIILNWIFRYQGIKYRENNSNIFKSNDLNSRYSKKLNSLKQNKMISHF